MRQAKRTGIGWAWEFQYPNGSWHLCNWAEPFQVCLGRDDDFKPSPEARKVRVELVPTSKRNRQRYDIPDGEGQN